MPAKSKKWNPDLSVVLVGVGNSGTFLLGNYVLDQLEKNGRFTNECLFLNSENSFFSSSVCAVTSKLIPGKELNKEQRKEIALTLHEKDLVGVIFSLFEVGSDKSACSVAELATKRTANTTVVILPTRLDNLEEAWLAKIKQLLNRFDRLLIIENEDFSSTTLGSNKYFNSAVEVFSCLFDPAGPSLAIKSSEKALSGVHLGSFIFSKKENRKLVAKALNKAMANFGSPACEMKLEVVVAYLRALCLRKRILSIRESKNAEDSWVLYKINDGGLLIFSASILDFKAIRILMENRAKSFPAKILFSDLSKGKTNEGLDFCVKISMFFFRPAFRFSDQI